jgi:hypothetical protein
VNIKWTIFILIEFEVKSSQTKATDKEIEFLVYIASSDDQ